MKKEVRELVNIICERTKHIRNGEYKRGGNTKNEKSNNNKWKS